MSTVHVLERPTHKDSVGEVARRSVETSRSFGSSVLSAVAGIIPRFETYMTAHSLPEGYERRCGLTALGDIDPAYAQKLKERLGVN